MRSYSLSHLADQTLLRNLVALVARERTTTAALLAHIAEVDARRLYVPAAYPSMHAYCVGELGLSEECAFKRICAARAARRCPALLNAIADGRLSLTAVVLLAPHLSPENADELLANAAHKTTFELKQLLAEQFPRLDVLTHAQLNAPLAVRQLDSNPVEALAHGLADPGQLDPDPVDVRRDPRPETSRPKVTPLPHQRFALQFTIGQSTYDKLQHAKALLGHQLPSGDLTQVIDRAIDALIVQLEKRKFAATANPRRRRHNSPTSGRHVPAEVKRAVWERDGGHCTFVNEAGRRCPARTLLEYDHIEPVARGGRATVAGIRLRCRAHNQYEAERVFGFEFMNDKRRQARRAAERAAEQRAAEAARARAAAEQAEERDVIPWLRQLGFRAEEARRAAAFCESIPDAPLEERVRVALSQLRPKARTHGGPRAAGHLGSAA